MNTFNIEELKNHIPSIIGMNRSKKSAVCIPLIATEEGYDLLFEMRSLEIDSQPGDICFPGGMVEEGESTQEAALREITEELLIDPAQVEIIAPIDIMAGGHLYLYPYAVMLKNYEGTFSRDEVHQVFRVPLSFFWEHQPEIYVTRAKVIPPDDFPYDRIYGGKNYAWRERREEILFYQYKEYNIWGITAKIIQSFMEILKGE